MTHKIFEVKDICVFEETVWPGNPTRLYTITNKEYGFTTSQKPTLTYDSLRALLSEAIYDKRMDIESDTRPDRWIK